MRHEGIVLRNMDYGEGHKILTIYTREAGKVSVMARGAKKLKSRHVAVSQMFTHAYFDYFRQGQGQMGTLNQGEIVETHQRLREDLTQSAYAAYIAELVWRITEDQAGSAYLFEQVVAAFQALESGKIPEIITHIMELKMLASAGYRPELEACVSCGAEDEPFFFHAAAGGLLCRACAAKTSGALPLSAGVRSLLRLLQRADLRRIGEVSVKPATIQALKAMMRNYMDTHLELQLKSRSFLDQLEKFKL